MKQEPYTQIEADNPSLNVQNRGSAKRKLSVNKRKSGASSTSLPSVKMEQWQQQEMEKHHKLMEDNLKRARETALREKNNQEREDQDQRDILERLKKEKREAYEKYLLANNRQNEENYLRSMPSIPNIYNKVNVLQNQNRKQDSENGAADIQNLKESTRQWMSRPVPLNNPDKYFQQQQKEKEIYKNQLFQIQQLKKRQVSGRSHSIVKEGEINQNNGQFTFRNEKNKAKDKLQEYYDDETRQYGFGEQIYAIDNGDENQGNEERGHKEINNKKKTQQKNVENGRYSSINEHPFYPSKGNPYSKSQANFDLKQQQLSRQHQSFLPPLSKQLQNQQKQVVLSQEFQKIKADRSESAKTQNSKFDGKFKPLPNSQHSQSQLDDKQLSELKLKQEQLIREKAELKRREALNSKIVPAIIKQNQQVIDYDNPQPLQQTQLIEDFKQQFNDLKKEYNYHKQQSKNIIAKKDNKKVQKLQEIIPSQRKQGVEIRSNDQQFAIKDQDHEEQFDTELDEASKYQYGDFDNNGDNDRDFNEKLDSDSGQRHNNNLENNSKISRKSFFQGQQNSTHTTQLLYSQNMKERRKFWEEKNTQEDFRNQTIEEKSKITAISKFRSKVMNNQKDLVEKLVNQNDQNHQQSSDLKTEKKKSEAQIWKGLNQQEVALQREILTIHFENYDKIKQIEDKNDISLANAINTSEILKSRAGSALSNITTKTNKTSKTIKSKGSSISGQDKAKGNKNLKKINPISENENEDDLEASLMNLEDQLNSKRTKIIELAEAQAKQSKPKNPQVQIMLLKNPAIIQQNPFSVDLTNPDKEYLEKEKEKIQEQKQQEQLKFSPRIQEKDIQDKRMVSRESRLHPKNLAREAIQQQQHSQIISSTERQPREVKSKINSTNISSSGSLLAQKQQIVAAPRIVEQEIKKSSNFIQSNKTTPEKSKPQIIMFQHEISSSKDIEISSSPTLTDKLQNKQSDLIVKTQDKYLQNRQGVFVEGNDNQSGNLNSSKELNQQVLNISEKGVKQNRLTQNDEINPQAIVNDKEELTKWWKSIQGNQSNQAKALGNSQIKQQQSSNNDVNLSAPKYEEVGIKKPNIVADTQKTIGISESEEKKVIDRKQQIKEEFMKQLNQSETDEVEYQKASYQNPSQEQDSLKQAKDQLNKLKESQENKNLRDIQQQKETNQFIESEHPNNERISQNPASPEPKKTLSDILDKNIIARVEYSQAQIEQTIDQTLKRIERLEIQQTKAVLESKKQKQHSHTDMNGSQDNVQSDHQLSEISHNASFTDSEFSVISGVGSYAVKATIKKEYKLTGKVPSRYPHPDHPSRNNSFISNNHSSSFSRLQGKDNNELFYSDEKQVILEEEDQGDIKINKNVNLQKLLFVD